MHSHHGILAAALLTLSVLACGIGPLVTSPAPTDVPAATDGAPAVNAPSGDARQELIEAFTRLETAYPYRLTESGVVTGCGDQARVTEFESASEYHTVFSGCAINTEVIASGGHTYYLVNGSWKISDEPEADGEAPPDVTALAREALTMVTRGANETVNGMDMRTYDFVLAYGAGDMTGRAWVGEADGLPHQATVKYPFQGFDVEGVLVYDYDVEVNIEVPVP